MVCTRQDPNLLREWQPPCAKPLLVLAALGDPVLPNQWSSGWEIARVFLVTGHTKQNKHASEYEGYFMIFPKKSTERSPWTWFRTVFVLFGAGVGCLFSGQNHQSLAAIICPLDHHRLLEKLRLSSSRASQGRHSDTPIVSYIVL